jgi:protein-S-isoprenylcysteine O-methyltransferase Ste14
MTPDKNGEHPLGDRLQLAALAAFMILWALDSFILRFSTWAAAGVLPGLRLAALAILLTAAYLLQKSGHVVVHGRERPQRIVTGGAFARVRHPLYLACLLFYLALAAASLSALSLAALIPIFLLYNYLAAYEERVMELRFGPAYQTYRTRVGRWIPRLPKKRA